MDIYKIYNYFGNWFRPTRAKKINNRYDILNCPDSRVLDVGGGKYPWNLIRPAAHITILNQRRPKFVPIVDNIEFVIGDGTNLKFLDRSFDLVYSNSVIEHVGELENQKIFANEMLRVGKSIYCQTPNKWFPFEPHLLTGFIHWFPYSIARKLVRYCSVWGIVTKPSQQDIDNFLSTIRLLTIREFKDLFPGCEIQFERICGLTKSFIAERVWK
jgi:hypothetical protein